MKLRVYLDFNDWWIGYYRGDSHHYICPFPTVVIRWNRKFRYREPSVPIDPQMSKLLSDIYDKKIIRYLRTSSDMYTKLKYNPAIKDGIVTFPIIGNKLSEPPYPGPNQL